MASIGTRITGEQLGQVKQQFFTLLGAGYYPPRDMVDMLQAANNALADHFESVNMWLPASLEQVGDTLMDAIASAQIQEQDYPQAAYA